MNQFRNRREAGRALARALAQHRDRTDVVVLGLARGGMPVAFEIATALQAPLDVLVVRTLGVPRQENLGMGAVATGGVRVLSPDVVTRLGITKASIEGVTAREWHELVRQERAYRGGLQPLDVRGRIAILADDGLSGAPCLKAAVTALRRQKPARLVFATPAVSTSTCDALSKHVDEIVCARAPERHLHLGSCFGELPAVSDEHVRGLLLEGTRESVVGAAIGAR